MDCRQAKHWIALIAGQDPTDSQVAAGVQQHLRSCPACRDYHESCGQTLSVLADSRRVPDPRRRLWPAVARRLAELDVQPPFLRFNVWIPTALASAACLFLVSVAMLEIQRESARSSQWQAASERDLFQSDPKFNTNRGQLPNRTDFVRWGLKPGDQVPQDFNRLELRPARSPAW